MIIQNIDKCYEVINRFSGGDSIQEFLCKEQELGETNLLVRIKDPILAKRFTLFLEEKVKGTEFSDYQDCFQWEEALYAVFTYSSHQTLAHKLAGENCTLEERAGIFCNLLEKMLLLDPHPYFMKNALHQDRITVSDSLDVAWNYHLDEETGFDNCKMEIIWERLENIFVLLFDRELKEKRSPLLEQYLYDLTRGAIFSYMDLYQEFMPVHESLCAEENKEPSPNPFHRIWESLKKVIDKPDSPKGYFRIGKHYIAKKAAVALSLSILLGMMLLVLIFIKIGYPFIQSRYLTKTMIVGTEETKDYTGKVRLIEDAETENLRYTGRLTEGKMDGEGTLYYPNGNIEYRGDFVEDRYEGMGKLYNEAGELIYEGSFLDGLYEGDGIYYYMGEIIAYEGSFSKGLYEGSGTLYYIDGQIRYEGGFSEGQYDGSGVLYYVNGLPSYEGEYQKGQRSGNGKLYNEAGELIYEGGFLKDLYEGEGTLYKNGKAVSLGAFHLGTLTSGETATYDKEGNLRYQGSIYNGLYDGEGKLYRKGVLIYDGLFDSGDYCGDGRLYDETTGRLVYEGSFYQDLYDGEGKLYDPIEGYLVYEGSFREGKYDGAGKSYANGVLAYEGEFLLGTYNGKGILYDQSTGTVVFEGVFYDNQPLQPSDDMEQVGPEEKDK
ncbi:MAG: hypothetical protein J1E61_08230 [Lachnospiraceae bacterium]|nr:hypothetical protein [Lachnospiraceae bacterium]